MRLGTPVPLFCWWTASARHGTWTPSDYRACHRAGERQQAAPPVTEVVHILGIPAHMKLLLGLRDRYGILIVEDAAEALGARIGDIAYCSFNGNKVITAGGGGMIVTDNPDLAAKCRHLTTQAKLPGRAYVYDEVGFNYRLTNIAVPSSWSHQSARPDNQNDKRR
jgi:hypothetical protein